MRLQSPGIAADEAYRRADGLIREIDRILRERQADELLKLWPNPLYPGNWPDALSALRQSAETIWSETATRWQDPRSRKVMADNLLVIVPLLLFALAVMWRGRRWTERLIGMLQGPTSERARRIWEFMASLVLIIVPTLGFIALSEALTLSRLLGPVGSAIAGSLGQIGLAIFAAVWLGTRVFPTGDGQGLLRLTADQRAGGRFLTSTFGLLLAVAQLRRVAMETLEVPDTATSVLNLPIILVGAVLILRMGQLIRASAAAEPDEESRGNYRQRLIGLVGRAAIAIGLIGPVLAMIGYISAGSALIFPAALSLGLAALLQLVQRLISDLYALITRSDGAEQDALAPVLISFALTLATLPLFALIWGARVADLTELWTKFQEGFTLGDSTISPTDFLFFAVVFGLGYALTRLFQGVMKNSILPRTGMDQGGQNALVSGLGYVGIFVAALVAINSTGIDLSGLAIVAGALSVGIGFGLQTVVSNFVSGIILLIERPISEGDWIEVGPVQGIVASISVRSTRIQTFDRSDVIVPNSDLISRPGHQLDAVQPDRAADRADQRAVHDGHPARDRHPDRDSRGAAPGAAVATAGYRGGRLWPGHGQFRDQGDPARCELSGRRADRDQSHDRRALYQGRHRGVLAAPRASGQAGRGRGRRRRGTGADGAEHRRRHRDVAAQ